jgi:hypothetical protein
MIKNLMKKHNNFFKIINKTWKVNQLKKEVDQKKLLQLLNKILMIQIKYKLKKKEVDQEKFYLLLKNEQFILFIFTFLINILFNILFNHFI